MCSPQCTMISWQAHDTMFRHQVSIDPKSDWSRLNSSLYAVTFLAQQNGKGKSCLHCLETDHIVSECPSKPPSSQERPHEGQVWAQLQGVLFLEWRPLCSPLLPLPAYLCQVPGRPQDSPLWISRPSLPMKGGRKGEGGGQTHGRVYTQLCVKVGRGHVTVELWIMIDIVSTFTSIITIINFCSSCDLISLTILSVLLPGTSLP